MVPRVIPTLGIVNQFWSRVTMPPAKATPMIALTIGRTAMNTERNTKSNRTRATARPISSA